MFSILNEAMFQYGYLLIRTHQTAHLTGVHYIICKLYLLFLQFILKEIVSLVWWCRGVTAALWEPEAGGF